MNWVKALPVDVVERDRVAQALVSGKRVALYVVDGEFFATSDTCTHGQASLSEGYLDGHLIECPLHQGVFDIRNGEASGPPCVEPVRTYPVRIEDNVIFVGIE
jgi:naphthalene 1,2-dioxygenase system ferredoxin subunit